MNSQLMDKSISNEFFRRFIPKRLEFDEEKKIEEMSKIIKKNEKHDLH